MNETQTKKNPKASIDIRAVRSSQKLDIEKENIKTPLTPIHKASKPRHTFNYSTPLTDLKKEYNSHNIPVLSKYVKTDNELFKSERKAKDDLEIEMNGLIGKYETPGNIPNNLELSINFELEDDKKFRNSLLNLNFGMAQHINSTKRNDEEIFDPATERDCSFIQNISIDNSCFVADADNKDNDVVLCISNLEIDRKEENLQSEEKFFNVTENNLGQFSKKNKENINLLSGKERKTKLQMRKYIIRFCVLLFLVGLIVSIFILISNI